MLGFRPYNPDLIARVGRMLYERDLMEELYLEACRRYVLWAPIYIRVATGEVTRKVLPNEVGPPRREDYYLDWLDKKIEEVVERRLPWHITARG